MGRGKESSASLLCTKRADRARNDSANLTQTRHVACCGNMNVATSRERGVVIKPGSTRGRRPPSGWRAGAALFRCAWRDWNEDNASRLAAALAYYTALSLAPMVVLGACC